LTDKDLRKAQLAVDKASQRVDKSYMKLLSAKLDLTKAVQRWSK
jgi:hypothetical protein